MIDFEARANRTMQEILADAQPWGTAKGKIEAALRAVAKAKAEEVREDASRAARQALLFMAGLLDRIEADGARIRELSADRVAAGAKCLRCGADAAWIQEGTQARRGRYRNPAQGVPGPRDMKDEGGQEP